MKPTLMFRFIVFHLALLSLLRGAFYLAFNPSDAGQTPFLSNAMVLGLRFDLRFTLILLLPLLVLGWRRWSPVYSDKARAVWSWIYTFFGSIWMLFYVFDFGFYGYLNSRMNSSVLSHLHNPDISLGMLWQSYPVVWIVLGFLGVVLLYGYFLQLLVFRPVERPWWGLRRDVLAAVFAVVFVGGSYGHFSQYPLRWSEAFFSPYHFLSHLSLNPVLYFFETYSFSNKKNYDLEEVRRYYDTMAKYLGVQNPDKQRLVFERPVVARHDLSRPNVVVIVMESLALSKSNLMKNPLNPTPELEKIALESHWFSNYYSPAEGTARNMFSIMTAIPDVSSSQTSSRNPLVVNQRLIINAFKDYKKMYLLGGSASWANIRGIFSHNIDDIDIIEEGSFDKGQTDVWGISDLDLFIEAHKKFQEVPKGKPFFAVIQSASFHRPYTIPADAADFQKLSATPEELQQAGFYSLDQFNSLRFSDYSLGHFFEMAKKSPYYANTIFIITGDHGLPDENGANVEAGSHLWNLEKYHVPLVIHNKMLLPKPTEDSRPTGHSDLMTTAAYLAGVDHFNTTMGRNLFDKSLDRERYSFFYNYYSESGEFGLLDGEFLYRFDNLKKGQLYEYRSVTPEVDVKDKHPDVFQRMDELARGHMVTSQYLLFNNSKNPATSR